MRLRAFLTLFLGMIVAGSAVFYTNFALKKPASIEAMRDVVVATADIDFGHVVEAEMLSLRSWPANAAPAGVFASIEAVLGDDEDKPRRAKRSITAGDLILDNKVSAFGERVTITQNIDPSMRAVAIRVNDVTGVAGFVAPADRIDITLTRNVDQELSTSTILQNVQVLGIDQAAEGSSSKPSVVKTVTVRVKPGDAQKLALAQQAGTLSLSLRHLDSGEQPVLGTISVGDLTAGEKPRPKVEPPLQRPSVVVNRGGERITVELPQS
jgi:pilus assembly protein CpaB